jgi:antitoxin HigA-1
MSPNSEPLHPGELLRQRLHALTGMTVTDCAKRLGVTRVALSRVLNCKAAISPDMAVRLSAALGGSDEVWLHLQADFDLHRARHALRGAVGKIAPITGSAP